MQLLASPIGKKVKIADVTTDEKTKNRLQNIGVIVGSDITVLQSNFGDIIVKVRDCRVAMNKDVAKHILVEAVNEEVTTDEAM
ncbi:MAG: ferrous iron transport protein A [Clostridia bacterium]|jgi:ferrous iron transport protein A|nr:ferrous iron transport protein A [Clostridia bacterium]